MLNKFITYSKNRILLKFILYSTITIILLTSIPELKKELNRLSIRKKQIETFFKAVDEDTDFTPNLKDKILYIHKKYIQNIRLSDPELMNAVFANQLNLLIKKYKLDEFAKIRLNKNYNDNIILNLNRKIQVHHYDFNIQFSLTDYNLLVQFIKEIYQLLPEGALIEAIKIDIPSILTHDRIQKLNSRLNILFNVEIKIQLREINYAQ